MKSEAATVVLAAAVSGAALALFVQGQYLPEDLTVTDHSGEPSDEWDLGSAHRHALFFVVVDGEKLEFTEDRYQLAADHVHLENNRSHIVHTHAQGVTWEEFFRTIELELNESGEETCLDVKNVSRCDNGTAVLNGEDLNVSRQIQQDDVVVVAVGENRSAAIERYTGKELPEAYRPAPPGRSL